MIMNRFRNVTAGLVLALGLATSAAQAEGKLATTDTLTSGDESLMVATYFDPDQLPHKVGLLGISHKISIAFTAEEWSSLTSLWSRAVAAQSSKWQTIGTFDETGTTDPSVLTVSAGQGVMFVISSPAKGAKTFMIAPADMDRLGTDLQNAQTSLNNQTSQ
jgi:hypothetical protein